MVLSSVRRYMNFAPGTLTTGRTPVLLNMSLQLGNICYTRIQRSNCFILHILHDSRNACLRPAGRNLGTFFVLYAIRKSPEAK